MKKLMAVCLMAVVAAGCVQTKKECAKSMDTKDFFVGKIADCGAVVSRHPRFKKAFDFLTRKDLATLPVGRYEIDGDNMWAMVMDAKLSPFGERQQPEVHGTYIDIQAPLDGPETIGLIALTDESRAKVKFDAEKDIGFFEAKTDPVTLHPGEFCILMPPYGAHAPGCSLDGSTKVRKLVIKIRK